MWSWQHQALFLVQMQFHRHLGKRNKNNSKQHTLYTFSTISKSLIFKIYESLFLQLFWPHIQIEHLHFSYEGNVYASSPYDVKLIVIKTLKIYKGFDCLKSLSAKFYPLGHFSRSNPLALVFLILRVFKIPYSIKPLTTKNELGETYKIVSFEG